MKSSPKIEKIKQSQGKARRELKKADNLYIKYDSLAQKYAFEDKSKAKHYRTLRTKYSKLVKQFSKMYQTANSKLRALTNKAYQKKYGKKY